MVAADRKDVMGIGDRGTESGKNSGINPPSCTIVLDNSNSIGIVDRGQDCKEDEKLTQTYM